MAASPPLIAHVVHRFDYGGLENGLVNLINGLPPGVGRHAVVCLTGATAFRNRLRRPDVAIHELGKQPGKDPAAYLRLWRLLRTLRPDILHTRNAGVLDCQVVGWAAGVPVRIHGLHGWDVDDLHGTAPRRRKLRRACDRFVSHYVAVSRQLRDWLVAADGVSPARITQVYNGVDIERFAPAPKSGERFVIGSVGRLQAVKDQATLLRAVGILVEQHPALRLRLTLRLVGDGPERAALEALTRELGLTVMTEFVGFRDDVAAELRKLDIFVLPSLNEGISNTVLEAMACGLPVVGTAVGGTPELVDDGRTGRLVAAGDAAALAECLARYAVDRALARAHGVAGRLRVEREFSIPRMLADYAALYRRWSARAVEAA